MMELLLFGSSIILYNAFNWVRKKEREMALPSSPPPTFGIDSSTMMLVQRNISIAMRGITFDQWLDEQMIGITNPYYNPADIVEPLSKW